jgi:hypothetical protein
MIAFVETDPKITPVKGMMRIDFESGTDSLTVAMSMHTLRLLVHRATRILDEEEKRNQQQVLEFQGARRG